MRIVAVLLAVIVITACAHPRIEYHPVPAWLMPERPTLPTIAADELRCLSDDAYTRLALRDRLRAQETAELRALLETGHAR